MGRLGRAGPCCKREAGCRQRRQYGLEAAFRAELLWQGVSADMMSVSGRMGRTGVSTMPTTNLPAIRLWKPAWYRSRIVGQKRPLPPKHVWAIRVRLEIAHRVRYLALFNTAIDSKLRGCDLVKLKLADVFAARQVKEHASITHSKTRQAGTSAAMVRTAMAGRSAPSSASAPRSCGHCAWSI